jgi:hypothetical protein
MLHHEKIKLLVRRRFPEFQKGVERGVLGPELPSVKAYTAEVESLPAAELDALVIEETRKETLEQEEAGQRADQIAFFSEPAAVANFRVWSRLDTWTIDEANALLLAKAPEAVSWRLLGQLKTSPFAMRFGRLRDQMLRAKADGKFKDRDHPTVFIEWAIQVGVDVPTELVAVAKSDAMSPPDAMSSKARASMLKLILGMAIKKYGYDPKQKKNTATKAITDDLAENGIILDEDTVRKYLSEAGDLSRSKPK